MRVGILGGTFNPVHLGHIKLAEDSFRKLGLDRFIFVPAYLPPHKLGNKKIAPWEDRRRMVELALEKKDGFEVSDIENRLKGRSYSIKTIKEFRRLYGKEAQIFFITGSDSARELESWKKIGELKRICSFVIATRPGYTVEEEIPGTVIIKVATPDISSTQIRRRIRKKAGFRRLVPVNVYNYIISNRLYL